MRSQIKLLLILFLLFAKASLNAQINRYWSQNFNDGSSMLAGAVVGGGAGEAAIYYNPATISEITESRFSLSLSLFSIDRYKLNNALGEDIDLERTKFIAQPRFVSYLIKLKDPSRIDLEVAFMNVANSNLRFTHAEDKEIDILKDLPGKERYFGSYNLENIYRDDYFGAGLSYDATDRFFIGASMFVSVKTVRTYRNLEIEAGPLKDTVYVHGNPIPAYSASFEKLNEVRFQNYSMIWKLGFKYKIRSASIGLNFSMPSVNLFTGGKFLRYKNQRSNISNPDGPGFLPDYIIIDQQQKRDFKVNYKTPFAVSLGATFYSPKDPDKTFFITAEYFSGLSQYTIVDAQDYPYIVSSYAGSNYPGIFNYSYAARDLLNIAIAYRWKISSKLLYMSGFKTDFNFLKDVDLRYNKLDNFHLNLYHLTSGFRLRLKKNVIMFGVQYSFSTSRDQMQIVNLKDPVEYNTHENMPLVGNRSRTMNINYNEISFFIGATLNFTKSNKEKE